MEGNRHCISYAGLPSIWKKYYLLIIIALLQITPPILKLIDFFKEKDWLIAVINISIIIAVVIMREIRSRVSSKAMDDKINQTATGLAELSGSTLDISGYTVNIGSRVDSLSTLLNSYDKRISKLEHRKGFRR